MKRFKDFIKESAMDYLKGRTEEEIQEIYNNLNFVEKLKYISEQREKYKSNIFFYPPINAGKVNGTNAIITFYYCNVNEFHGVNEIVFNLLYDETEDKEFNDTKFEFTYIDSEQIIEHNHKGEFLHHREQKLTLELDDDLFEKMAKIAESSKNVKLNDHYYEIKEEYEKLLHKKPRTEEEQQKMMELKLEVDTISDGKESVWGRKQLEERKAMTLEERERIDKKMREVFADLFKKIEEDESK